ncbi:MAG: hypothetical protein HC817_08380 [Saprospiraceae bacterium]|nr:hypothetical protein [Saprospiraceae bacterium]
MRDAADLTRWAGWLGWEKARAGRFKIQPNWSSYELIKHLQKGEQSPVKVVLNNERTPAQVAAKVAKTLELDSAAFNAVFTDTAFLDSLQLAPTALMCVFLPNTYEFFWNTEPEKFLERMTKEYRKFWNDNRTARAKSGNMTPEQAVTMASIVEGETRHNDERPKVAAVYLNRYKNNMKLQADPTVQYALMEIEKRVLSVAFLTAIISRRIPTILT